jgi:hypothetical protein
VSERANPPPETAETDVARGEEAEHGTEDLGQRVDEAERTADEARDDAEQAANREKARGIVGEDVGGEAPELDRPEETPKARQ